MIYIVQGVLYRIFYTHYIFFSSIYIAHHRINCSSLAASRLEWNKIATFKAIVTYKEPKIIQTTIGSKIKKYRLINSISQRELAKLIKISKSNMYLYEHNKLYPRLDLLNKMAEIFNIDVKQLMDDYLLFIYNPNYKRFFIELEHKIKDVKNTLGIKQLKYSRWKNGMEISKKSYIHLRNKLLKLKIYDIKKYVIY
ncbi:helix-turn-helix domain-containing protein [Clostridium sp. HV4-5-A1G]|uniref:helix-turn-helix domain-containing protein n=1 Tax=Clostridium sp. HV4-5-A1G TaxID=2004595 RepID=UPI001238B911|nr:helix-turn-helix transcriptional regulator [Clostridium sp. HV4-5-A1G]